MNAKMILTAAQAGMKISGKWAMKNLPTILTTIGTGGVLYGVYKTAKVAPEAKKALDEVHDEWDALSDKENRSKVDYIWKVVRVGSKYYYVVALVVGGSIVCFWLANHINIKRLTAALVTAKVSSESLKELQDKIKETEGEKKLTKLQDEIAQDRIEKVPLDFDAVYGVGEHLVYDPMGRHFFMSNIEKIKRAVENAKDSLRDQVRSGEECAFYSINEFLADCGGDCSDFGELIGFGVQLLNPHNASTSEINDAIDSAVDITFSSVLKNGVPALEIVYRAAPTYRYYE